MARGAASSNRPSRESFAAKVSIASYPVEEYLGILFAYLGEDAPPAFPDFPEIEDESRGVLTTRLADVRAISSRKSRTTSMNPTSISFTGRRPRPRA